MTNSESFTCEFVADDSWHVLTETQAVRVELKTKALNPDIPELAVVDRVRITDVASGSRAEFSAAKHGDLADSSVSPSIGSGSVAYTGWVRASDAKDNYGGGTEDFMNDAAMFPTRIMRWTADRDVVEDVTVYGLTNHLDAWNRIKDRTDTNSLGDRLLGPRPGLRPLGTAELAVRVRVVVNRPVVDAAQAAWRSGGRRGMLLPQRPCPGNRKTPHVFFATGAPTAVPTNRTAASPPGNATASPTAVNTTAPTSAPSAAPSRSPTTARRTAGTIEMDRLYAMARDPALSDTYLGPSYAVVNYGTSENFPYGYFNPFSATGFSRPPQTYWLGCRATKVGLDALNPGYVSGTSGSRKWTTIYVTVADEDLVACRIDTLAARYLVSATRGGDKPAGLDNVTTLGYLTGVWSLVDDRDREPGAVPDFAPRAPQMTAFAWAYQERAMVTTNGGGSVRAGLLVWAVGALVGVVAVAGW